MQVILPYVLKNCLQEIWFICTYSYTTNNLDIYTENKHYERNNIIRDLLKHVLLVNII